QQYWIIDRFRRIMIVYRKGLAGPTYELITEAQDYETDLLPGFVLPLKKLLQEADRWRPQPKPRASHSQRQPRAPRSRPRNPNPPAGGTA
ncbi:MAG: hypothetical protein ACP5XB_26915, partial [Isosphaeraceae bacterium]